jgi:hypothetical protein
MSTIEKTEGNERKQGKSTDDILSKRNETLAIQMIQIPTHMYNRKWCTVQWCTELGQFKNQECSVVIRAHFSRTIEESNEFNSLLKYHALVESYSYTIANAAI